MQYIDRFNQIDSLVAHLTQVILMVHDNSLISKYAGLLSVATVTAYELAIKDILKNFAYKKHPVFGAYIENELSTANGRIKLPDLKKNYIRKIGDKYLSSFEKKIQYKEKFSVKNRKGSIINAYNNLIICRNKYVHGGNVTLSFQEVLEDYELGKEVICTLFESMKR